MVDKNLVKKYIPIILLILIMVFVFRGRLLNMGIITHGDWTYAFEESLMEYFYPVYGWFSLINSGPTPPFTLSNYPMLFLYGLFSVIGISVPLSVRILYIYPVIFLTPISMYYLMQKMFKNKKASFFAALIFSLNSFILLEKDHMTWVMAYALTPLILAFYADALDTKRIRSFVITAILFGLSMMYEVRFSYIIAGLVILYTLFNFYCDRKDMIKKIKGIIVSSLLIIGLSAYWTIPFIFSNLGESISNILPASPWISWANIIDGLVIRSSFYSLSNIITAFKIQPLEPIFLLIPIIAFSALLFRSKKEFTQKKLFFAAIALIGIFLIKQENPPFGWIYTWLFNNFPGFSMFRVASKFYLFVGLGVSILFGLSINGINRKIKGFIKSNYFFSERISYIFLAFAFLLIIIIAMPAIFPKNGDVMYKGYYPISGIPDEYIELKGIVQNELQPNHKILWLPRKSRFSFYSYEHPIISTEYDFLEKMILRNIETLETEHIGNYLSSLNIGYVILLPDLAAFEDRIGELRYNKNSKEKYMNFLDSQKDLERIKENNYVVYKNLENSELFRVADEIASEYSDSSNIFRNSTSANLIKYERIDPTLYKVYVNADRPFLLSFGEVYNSMWTAETQTGQYDSDPLYSITNSFWINETGNLSITVRYKPQNWFSIGFIIFVITLIICIIYLVYEFIIKSFMTQ